MFALEKATSELEIQITSRVTDYVTQMTAVSLRCKQLDDVSELIQEVLPAFTIPLPTIGM